MIRELLDRLVCPYCGGGLRLSHEVSGTAERLRYGLLECRCFTFPVVDGIPLLSLAKAYGGAEERLQPYVPLQVAAIKFLKANDLDGLRGWIARHLPLAADLMADGPMSFIDCSMRMAEELESASTDYLAECGRYEVLGHPGLPLALARAGKTRRLRTHLRQSAAYVRARLGLRKLSRRLSPEAFRQEQLNSYYVARYFMPRRNSMALQCRRLPAARRLLSLCCGHGVFEHIQRTLGHSGADVVSVDGQFLNLLITRRYAAPDGNYICHDIQFPLPFADGAFDGVFSSTCLPEIPSQKSFVREALRVTDARGWTCFDSIWGLSHGLQRVNGLRYYRFCQNLFAEVGGYLELFGEVAGGRTVLADVPDQPERYARAAGWRPAAELRPLLGEQLDSTLHVLVLPAGSVSTESAMAEDDDWPRCAQLAISPAYSLHRAGSDWELQRLPVFSGSGINVASRDFIGMPDHVRLTASDLRDNRRRRELFSQGVLALLPEDFGTSSPLVADLLNA
ncbi:MAG: methyltransferase domain-containing protein [Stagnimonas sp.]|nr:methyltransferase domain-containing protein [Stagnimonas sp.]